MPSIDKKSRQDAQVEISTPMKGDARISDFATPQQVREMASPAHGRSLHSYNSNSPREIEVAKPSPCKEITILAEPASPVASHRNTRGNFPVYLHVYDLGPVSRFLVNSWALSRRDSSCLGVFHCGVEVLGVEFSFQAMADCGEDDDISGLTWHNPKSHPRHVYRESICLGNCQLTVSEVGKLLEKLEKAWPARTYHCLSNNCVDFAEQFIEQLRCPDPFPRWVHGLAKNLAKNDQAIGAGKILPCSWGSCASTSMGSISANCIGDPTVSAKVDQSTDGGKLYVDSMEAENVLVVEEKPHHQQIGCSLFSVRA
mmetsp:Transcript_28402/g.51287  ORF Transcript_28402/g.51287 Transcript_28402/m.51287 type:complete len:313 (-) Transcript_28402:62-1000(-)|eukprot:CAMPEP_0197651172 /NCGR_PEP_ID=MMETSP1338-20131121/31391_1 /TAXON_ID=43686 ORGANISM="Pelagodinium beii, Strain RCC1491" /NCGR_SAMPLE_ID=MMETSP1338 /ASSEMBLY_ACC=CAM_ASM_000754 /LENGTH=312 /DNA_ID=CAMNT_0043225737 /DNA_START=96 /DNA_END=1034 /DNA_ORIENTATION=+